MAASVAILTVVLSIAHLEAAISVMQEPPDLFSTNAIPELASPLNRTAKSLAEPRRNPSRLTDLRRLEKLSLP